MEEILKLINLDVETFSKICAMVYFFVEAIKAKFSGFFSGGVVAWRTDVLAIIISMALSAVYFWPSGLQIVIVGIMCWLMPSGINQVLKKKEG